MFGDFSEPPTTTEKKNETSFGDFGDFSEPQV